jgi:hypothetical protein
VGCCLYVREGEVLLGTTEAHLLRVVGTAHEAVESFDEAPDRDQWFTPWGGPPAVRSMTQGADGELYVNVHVGGILRSAPMRDDGWQPTIGIRHDVHQVIYHEEERELLAATARGLARSVDRGNSWRLETAGLHAFYCRAVSLSRSMLFLTASDGPHAGGGALYRKPLHDGASFELCANGIAERFPQNLDTHCLSAQGRYVAVGTAEGAVYASDDEGDHWEVVAADLPPVNCVVAGAA